MQSDATAGVHQADAARRHAGTTVSSGNAEHLPKARIIPANAAQSRVGHLDRRGLALPGALVAAGSKLRQALGPAGALACAGAGAALASLGASARERQSLDGQLLSLERAAEDGEAVEVFLPEAPHAGPDSESGRRGLRIASVQLLAAAYGAEDAGPGSDTVEAFILPALAAAGVHVVGSLPSQVSATGTFAAMESDPLSEAEQFVPAAVLWPALRNAVAGVIAEGPVACARAAPGAAALLVAAVRSGCPWRLVDAMLASAECSL